jgi:uncharacterized membrane protein
MVESPQQIRLNRIIFLLSVIGVLIAVYVTQSFSRKSPIVCVSSGCELVRKNPASYLLGIPVPAVGLVGYTVLVILAFLRSMSANPRLLWGMVAISTFGILFVSWFTFTELTVIKGICTWCAISAVNMYIIFGLTVKSVLQANKMKGHHV